jgi:hypothetical protein
LSGCRGEHLEKFPSASFPLINFRDWYRSARAVRPIERLDSSTFDTIAEEKSGNESQDSASPPHKDGDYQQLAQGRLAEQQHQQRPSIEAAQKELQVHELLALSSCFLFPAIGAWLLHTIRGQLSRPSEGLVSNYNLTVFLLASEIRPISHLVKMIQARTLYLQRVVNANLNDDEQRLDSGQVSDLAKRVEELEAHVADSVERFSESKEVATKNDGAKTVVQAVSESRKSLQPELDALNRAVRRYEKRTTISSLQTEARLQDLESRLKDVVVLAAAAQRNAESQPKNFAFTLLNWMCAIVVLPSQFVWSLIHLPIWAAQWAAVFVSKSFRPRPGQPPKQTRQGNLVKARDRRPKIGS